MANNEVKNNTLPSQIHTPTAMGALISIAVNTRQKVDIPKWTTLNEKYNVLAEESIGIKDGSQFVLGYYGLGIKGSRCTGQDANGLENRMAYQHFPNDFAAFFPIPFVMRLITEDLSEGERDNYRMRVVVKIPDTGLTYACYYLRKIDFTNFDPHMKLGYKEPDTGNVSVVRYTPKEADLSPQPYELLSTDSVPISNQYINSTGSMDLSLSGAELDELKNVCRILFGDASKAAVTEYYTAFGIETIHPGAPIGNGGTVRYKELISAVVSYHVTEMWARDPNANNILPIKFQYGNSVPFIYQPLNPQGKITNDSITNIVGR